MLQISLIALFLGSYAGNRTAITWQTDYGSASTRAANEKKPLAVFIDKGTSPQKVVLEGKLTAETTQLLSDKFVCVFIDAASDEGKKLAQSFEMEQGLILSDNSGAKQALRHTGAVATTDLNRYLTEQAETTTPAPTTLTGTTISPAPSRRTPLRNLVAPILNPFSPECRT